MGLTRFTVSRKWLAIGLALTLMTLSASAVAVRPPTFVPPQDRPLSMAEQPWPNNRFLAICYHDVRDDLADQRYLSVRTSALRDQFTWLRENGYHPVTVDQILEAHKGGTPLPDRAVLLTFDDGYSSFYHRVFPLLNAFNYPALLAPVGVWLDTPANQQVDFGGLMTDRDRFATWAMIHELSRSPLVEIGAHSYNSHYGAIGNPQGNRLPVAANRRYDPKVGGYETDRAFLARMDDDIVRITARVEKATGKAPRVWVWPYGAANGDVLNLLSKHGYSMAMTLEDGFADARGNLMNVPRLLVAENPDLTEFASQVITANEPQTVRVVHVDLDYIYDPDPGQQDKNLNSLVQRIYDMRVTHVFLQAFADPGASGNVREVYFPNRWLPVRADLFNRVSWQLSSRAGVKVFAWMPVMAFELDKSLPRVLRYDPNTGQTDIDPKQYRRLSPFNPEARRRIIDIYEDLARYSPFQGLIFHDDAVLSDFEDVGSDALKAYIQAGLPGTIDGLRAMDSETFQRWTRFKSRYLVDFTLELADRVKAIRGPQVQTARNMFVGPILEPKSEAWFAQNLDDFLAAYDLTVPMAMPLMEGVPNREIDAWFDRLVGTVAQRPNGLDRTVFELQARDWNIVTGEKAVDSDILVHWMRRLQRNGARNFGYYPDDFVKNQPPLEQIKSTLSPAWGIRQ